MGERKVVYIAGPITGVPNYWEAFEQAEDEIEAAGYVPLTPTRLPSNISNAKAMHVCLAMINVADAVYFLPGWDRSIGAQLEMAHCKYMNKLTVHNVEELREVLG